MEARDPAALAAACTPDVAFNSPISMRVRFEGRQQFADLFRSVLEVYDDIRCVGEHESGTTSVLHLHARVGFEELDEIQLLRLDDQGRVREITMFVRPLPGLAALTAALPSRLVRRRSRAGAVLVALMTRPLAAATRIGDRLGARLIKP